MNQITCHEHHVATMADACAVNARSYGGAWLGSFLFVTKPYADQRPTGAPPADPSHPQQGKRTEAASNLAVFLFSSPFRRPTHHHPTNTTHVKRGDEVMQTLVDTTIHTTISVADLPWEDIAACRAVPNAADLFFSEDIGDIAAAKRVCADCSVLAECLEAALDRRELFGVWGGQLFINGKMLTVKRRRGRPRRSPSGGPDAGRADSGASAGHRPEAVRLSPSQPGGGVVPGPRHPTIPPPPAPASPTARVTSIELRP